MNKDYVLEIRPIQNGFIVEKSWRKWTGKPAGEYFEYDYKSEKYMLADWDAVVEWVKNNTLETVPAQD